MIDDYESAVDGTGRFGAFFERDDATSYFYLLDMRKQTGRIIAAFNVKAADKQQAGKHITVKWNRSGEAVGLFVGGKLSALFDLQTDSPTARWANIQNVNLFRTN